MHPTAIDTNYMARVVEKAMEYGGVDSFEVCGLEQKGINALLLFERYPQTSATVDRAFVEKTRADLNAVCELAHGAGKPVYFWHRENLVPKGIFEDVPELLDADGEFDLLSKAYGDYLRYKIDDVFRNCPGLDGLVLTLTESEYSVLHNSNQERYPAVKVVQNLVGVFTEELGRRGKRFILRSFGDGEDHEKIIGGAIAASRQSGVVFEIETKVTEADFVPWLPKNKYLKRDRPLELGAECDALGEFLGAGYLPAAQVHRIKEYVDSAREEGASRYAIRIDRKGFSIFDSAHEINLHAYMRFIRDPKATADDVIAEYAAKRFGAAAKEMSSVLASELELVRNVNYVCSNLTFHAFPIGRDFKYVKAGGIFSLYRENEPLADMEPIWSILSWMRAPTHRRILEEKDRGVALAEKGLAAIERFRDEMPADEYGRQRRAFANAVTLSKALRAYTRCVVAYFEDMAEGSDEPKRLAKASAEASATIDALRGGIMDRPYLDGIGFLCREFLREYRIERAMRRKLQRPDVYDFVLPGCITDDGRVVRLMHAAYPETKTDRIVRYAGNNRFPIGRITVKLHAPESARIEVALDPDGASACDVRKSWADGIWTVSIGKTGADYPAVLSVAAVRGAADTGTVKAAWFEADVSCDLGVGIAGYDGGDVAKSKLDDLKVCGLCLDDGKTKALVLSFDLLFLDIDTIRRYRRFAADKLGMKPEAVLVSCTHTHGGPHTRAYEKGRGEDDEFVLPTDMGHADARYVQWLDGTVERAVSDFASGARWRECLVGYYSSSCDENRNRRFTTADNCASFIAHRRALHGIATGVADKELGTVALLDPKDRAPLYVIGNYAAHPLASHAPGLGGLRITSDFPGFYRRYIESETGAKAMFVQGAAGDLVPKGDELGVAAARRTGENLAMASLAAVIDIQRNRVRFVIDKPRIAATVRTFESPVRRVWRDVLKKDRLTLEVQCLAVGDVAFVGLPGEPVCELGLEIKWHSPFRRTFIAYEATGNCGYVSPENLIAAGGYEPQYQEFVSRDTLKLVEVARDALVETRNKIFPSERTGEDTYPDNQNLPLVNLPGGIKASKWQK